MAFPISTALKGKLEARPYNGQRAFVAASFQLAILSFWVGMSLEASEASRRVPIYRSTAESTVQPLRAPLDRRNNRKTHSGRWEVKLDPSVNRVLPVNRRCVSALWARFDELGYRPKKNLARELVARIIIRNDANRWCKSEKAG